jgi:endoglucanase
MISILDIVTQHGFNALRIPIALDSYNSDLAVGSAHLSTFANPELSNARFRDVLDRVIQQAAARDLLVLLDLHRLAAAKWPTDGMWYSNSTTEEDVLQFWSSVAERYKDRKIYWNIIGADIFNEPHGTKSWSNWKKFVERASVAISAHAPSWLILAEGVGNEAGQVKEPVFWAENLHPAYSDPPAVRPDHRKLVLSPHVYGTLEADPTPLALCSTWRVLKGVCANHALTCSLSPPVAYPTRNEYPS